MKREELQSVFLQSEAPGGLSSHAMEQLIIKSQGNMQHLRKVLVIPPDHTRLNAYAGQLTAMLLKLLPANCRVDILPALGTHTPMGPHELNLAFPGLDHALFREHHWREDITKIGDVPAVFMAELSAGTLNQTVAVEVNRLLLEPSYERIFSIGQVVPHEVAGMANYNKNLLIGCGGASMINNSHLLGALYGMERTMGRDNTPVHRLFDYAEQHFLNDPRIQYLLTVTTTNVQGKVQVESLAVGRGRGLFAQSIRVSQQKNINLLKKPVQKAVVTLQPDEFKSTWLGNKAIYRTRLMMADGGTLLILAPGVNKFGEDPAIDLLIRKYGYAGRERIISALRDNADLQANQSAAAHLIHGSTEGRFEVVYAPVGLSEKEVKEVGFGYMNIQEALNRYPTHKMQPGYNHINGEEIYFIQNPALGLWALEGSFEPAESEGKPCN
ncbi:MAG: lactate racemase domain-containing protein [Anaerolineaceae bacterium]|nr:lactate racemase domain-containing protein [Anaerolineaceae bacterium]